MPIAPSQCCHCNAADVHVYPFETEGVKCAHPGCKAVFHAGCCSLAARGVGLLCDPTKAAHMLCTLHFTDLSNARRRQSLFFKYVQAARTVYLDANKVTTNDEPHAPLTVQPANVLGMITQTPMEQLCAGGSIGEGGFRQRAVASFGASVIETLIRDNGFNVMAGNFAIQELPYTQEELLELKAEGLLPEDFDPPAMLSSMRPANAPVGSWIIDATDPTLRMKDRRFVVIDGNNRITALVNLTSETPDFLKGKSLNTYLVELNLFNPVEVLCASMQCNKLSSANIANTLFDVVQQFQTLCDVYCRLTSTPCWKLSTSKLNIKGCVTWLEREAPQAVRDLIPEDTLEHTKVGKMGFNSENITSKVRLATLLPQGYLLKMQNRMHAMAASGVLPTTGWGATFCLSYMKMGPLWMPDTPYEAFLEHRVLALDKTKLYRDQHYSSWLKARKDHWKRFVGCGSADIFCHLHIFKSLQKWVQLFKVKLHQLRTEHHADPEILQLIPWPAEDGYDPTHDQGRIGESWEDVESKLVAVLRQVLGGEKDWDLFQVLCDTGQASKVTPMHTVTHLHNQTHPHKPASCYSRCLSCLAHAHTMFAGSYCCGQAGRESASRQKTKKSCSFDEDDHRVACCGRNQERVN